MGALFLIYEYQSSSEKEEQKKAALEARFEALRSEIEKLNDMNQELLSTLKGIKAARGQRLANR